MKKFALSCLLLVSVTSFANIEEIVEKEAPKNRYINSTFSLIFGGLSLDQAFYINRHSKLRDYETEADLLFAIGLTRVIDAVYTFSDPTDLEKRYPKLKNNPEGLRRFLKEEAKFGQMRKNFRATMVALTALAHTSLYLRDEKEFEESRDIAIFLWLVAAFKYSKTSPEQMALNITPNFVGFSYRF
jgi:hypothetical protein